MFDFGFIWFPRIEDCNEAVVQCQVDLLGLLRFEPNLQTEVVKKITSFLSRIVHKTIFYLKYQGMIKGLEVMWCSLIVRPNDKPPLH
jgi:hypothetical protein